MINFKKNILLKKLLYGFFLISIIFNFDIFKAQEVYEHYIHYPPGDGGLSAKCLNLVQDEKGYLWIATDDGLCRFDGVEFKFYTKNDGLLSDEIRTVCNGPGNTIFIGTRGGLNCIKDDKISSLALKDDISKLFYDKDENELFSLNRRPYFYYSSFELDSNFRHGHYFIRNQHSFKENKYVVTQDTSGYDLICLGEEIKDTILNNIDFIGDIFIYKDRLNVLINGEIKELVNNKIQNLDSNNILSLLPSGVKEIKVINSEVYYLLNDDLYRFIDGDNLSIIEDDGIIGLRNLYIDNENNLWVCTDNGIIRLIKSSFRRYDTKSGLIGKSVKIINDSVGNLLVCTRYGLFIKKKFANRFEKIISGDIRYVQIVNDQILILGLIDRVFGLYVFNSINGEIKEIAFQSEKYGKRNLSSILKTVKKSLIGQMVNDEDGNVYIIYVNANLILKIDKDFNIVDYFGEGRLGNEGWLPCLHIHTNGDIWYRSNSGISRIRKGEIKEYKIKIGEDLFNGTNTIHETNNGDLICTGAQGLAYLQLDDSGVKNYMCFDKINGLSGNAVWSSAYFNDSILFLGTSRGLNKVFNFNDSVTSFFKNPKSPKNLNIQYYYKADGLIGVDFTYKTFYVDDNSSLWMGTTEGLVHYLPKKDIPNVFLPTLFLKDILFQNSHKKNWKVKNGRTNDIVNFNSPVFYYNQNDLTFEVKAISTSKPKKLKYNYFLEGYEERWSEPTTIPISRYSNLNPGSYNFKCFATRITDGRNSEIITYSFVVSSPLYKKPWFIVLIIVGFVGFIIGVFFLRQRQLKADNLKLEYKVSLRTQQLAEEKQKVEKKNHQILQSINYAKRIQTSILPEDDLMKSFFSNHFVLYQPKDVVGGDFYWFRNFGEIAVLATVDCTGHGVPGGFMSMMGSLLLDKIVQENNLDTSKILSELNKEIIRVLKQENDNSMQDGMDMAICVINKKDKKLSFSGARNGLFIMDQNNKKYYDADLYPVGGFYSKKSREVKRVYKSNTIELKDDSWVFMYTDGYYDQLGGERMLSLGMDLFMAHLSKAVKSSDDNVTVLKEEYNKWRGKMEPIDDVLVIGFQV